MDKRDVVIAKERTVYIDYLRIAATFAVVMIHAAAQNWYTQDVSTSAWKVFNFYDSISRWAVPVFVMISGMLMLGTDVSFKKLYTVKIPRRLTAFIVWSLVYALVQGGTLRSVLLAVIKGKYHLWFLYLIIGLYICSPVIKKISENPIIAEYFLGISLVFSFVIPFALQLLTDFGGKTVEAWVNAFTNAYSDMNITVLSGYVTYFIAGYRLEQVTISRGKRTVIYFLGVLGVLATFCLSQVISVREGAPLGNYYEYLGLPIFAPSVAAFVWFKYNLSSASANSILVKQLTKCSFGIYLIHILVLETLDKKLLFNTMSLPAMISVPVLTVVVFVISFAIAALLKRIPVFKDYAF